MRRGSPQRTPTPPPGRRPDPIALDTGLYSTPPSDPAQPLGEPSTIWYVNAYEVSRHYGGAEEGGWWYDAGTPLASIPVRTEGEAHEAAERLRTLFADDYRDRRTRFSVIGEEDLLLCLEPHVAAPYPETIPHYE